MRIGTPQNVENTENRQYKIIAVDDEQGIVDSLSIFLKRTGYQFTGVTDPMEAIERVRNEHFDLMILDFIMTPFHGDQVVEEIRKFNKDLYILLLTGHRIWLLLWRLLRDWIFRGIARKVISLISCYC